jgi:hypothetical protein
MSLLTDVPTEKGTSGAWVVRGSTLLGVIVAVYENEPYAHMLPMEQVFADIRAAYTDHAASPMNVGIGLPPVESGTTIAADS